MQPPSDEDWTVRMRRIAAEWLFADVPQGGLPETVIMPFENPYLHEHAMFVEHLHDVVAHKAVTIGQHQGATVAVLRSVFGAPAAAMAVDVLASLGVKNILGVGYCGGLQPNVACGDLVLASAAVRDEGVSKQYVSESYPAAADPDMLECARTILRQGTTRWHCGPVWTTDAIMRESSAAVERWSDCNVLGVDMETSALLTLARMFRMRAVSLLVASDHPADPSLLKAGTSAAIEAGFRIVTRVAEA